MGSVKSALYAYCVTRLDANESWDVFPGIGERSVFAVREQKVSMLVSRLEKVKLEEQRHVVQHCQVLNRIFERRTVLPFRFGTVFQSEEEIRGMLLRNRDQFVEGLRVLRGKAEVHLKISFRAARPTPVRAAAASAGATNRLTVSSQGYSIAPPRPIADTAQKQVEHLIECVRTTVQPIQDQISVRYLEAGQVQIEMRCLVPDTQVDFCKKAALTSLDRLEERQLQVTGPWPPCHFLPVTAKLPSRAEKIMPLPGRLPLRSRATRV